MIQAQDVLGLGSEARMNNPARPSGNWRWRLGSRALTPAVARRLREVTEEAGRLAETEGFLIEYRYIRHSMRKPQ